MAAMDQIKERVEKLYQFRDEYFKTHDISEAAQKPKHVQQEIDDAVKLIESLRDQVPAEARGELHLLHGRALNATSEHSTAAEEVLGRATRFNFPDAWNELGECQYKKGDFNSALTCFQKALRLAEKKVYFRNMSMLMRSLPWKTPKEREENVTKGLEYARQALQRDMSDGHSWLVLGNAYLAAFFTVEAKMESLRHCKAAYSKAANDPLAVVLPELHFSKFHVQWYEEDYSGALRSLLRAYELEPTWEECKNKFDECHRFLQKLALMVHNRGQLNQRRLNTLMADIQPNQLGPYEGVGSSLTGGAKLDLTPLALLAEGSNQDKTLSFRSLRVAVPLMLVVNKRPVTASQIATSQIVSQQKPE